MNLDALRDDCLSFPDAAENVQWGADLVFKVRGKMFTVASLEPGRTSVSFKCTPEEFAGLVEQDGIEPAAYVARYHGVTLVRWDALPDREIRRLVATSYALVRAKLPKGRGGARTPAGAKKTAASGRRSSGVGARRKVPGKRLRRRPRRQ